MKTAKEFFERLQSDKDFLAQVNEKIMAEKEGGAKDAFAAIIKVAEQEGYEVTEAQLQEMKEKASDTVSDEELAKLSGGFCVIVELSIVTIFTLSLSISYG